MATFIKKYFETVESYPSKETLLNRLQDDVLFEYVSSTYLYGFVNYTSVQKAYLMGRYRDWNELESGEKFTKQQKFDAFLSKRNSSWNFFQFDDDVIILAKCGIHWVLFWFDCDTSDCCGGKFHTLTPDETVIKDFEHYIHHELDFEFPAKEIPLIHFKHCWFSDN